VRSFDSGIDLSIGKGLSEDHELHIPSYVEITFGGRDSDQVIGHSDLPQSLRRVL
jgi:hypothetical protein